MTPYALQAPIAPQVLYGGSIGVDEAFAATNLLQAHAAKEISLTTILAAGNVIEKQAALNAFRIIDLTKVDVPAYPGARAPLAAGNNETKITDFEQKIEEIAFYGKDGLMDVGGWPNVTVSMQDSLGSQQIISMVKAASNQSPLRIVWTGPLTTLAEAFGQLAAEDFAHIGDISIRGGCQNPTPYNCDAPPNVPDFQKNSERFFFMDPAAAQIVFAKAAIHNVPIYLSTLNLSQGALWTKDQEKQLEAIDNAVSKKFAYILNIQPTPYARRFPSGQFPVGAIFASGWHLWPQFFNETRVALSIGDVGQLIINPNATDAEKNVRLLSMSPDSANRFYQTAISQFAQLNCNLAPWLAICQQTPSYIPLILEIAIPIGVGAGIIITVLVCMYRRKKPVDPVTVQLIREDVVVVSDTESAAF